VQARPVAVPGDSTVVTAAGRSRDHGPSAAGGSPDPGRPATDRPPL